jgi:hypothetical protein
MVLTPKTPRRNDAKEKGERKMEEKKMRWVKERKRI